MTEYHVACVNVSIKGVTFDEKIDEVNTVANESLHDSNEESPQNTANENA